MGIYLSDMEMPKSCSGCPTCRDGTTLDGDYWLMCGCNGKPLESEIAAGKPDWCPLIPVPPHGRLIDADAMLMRINHAGMEAYMDGVCYGVHPSSEYLDLLGEIIDDAPTIIPEEEG